MAKMLRIDWDAMSHLNKEDIDAIMQTLLASAQSQDEDYEGEEQEEEEEKKQTEK